MRTTPTNRSRNRACVRNSGPVVSARTPVSRSTLPSRSGPLSLVRLLHETQAHAGRFRAQTGKEGGPEILDKAIAGAQGKGPYQPLDLEFSLRTQDGFRFLHQPADPLAQFERPRRGNEAAPGSNEKRVARRLTQPLERPAHGRGAQAQPLRGARDAAFGEQHVQGDEEVEIGLRHEWIVAPFRS